MVWRSDLASDEKRERLMSVRKAVAHYIERLDRKRTENANDLWRVRAFDRVRSYLTQLAADVEELALECERSQGPKPSLKPVNATYVT